MRIHCKEPNLDDRPIFVLRVSRNDPILLREVSCQIIKTVSEEDYPLSLSARLSPAAPIPSVDDQDELSLSSTTIKPASSSSQSGTSTASRKQESLNGSPYMKSSRIPGDDFPSLKVDFFTPSQTKNNTENLVLQSW
jgi:hypothetical protein